MFVIAPSPARRRTIAVALGVGDRFAATFAEARLLLDEAPAALVVDLAEGDLGGEQLGSFLAEYSYVPTLLLTRTDSPPAELGDEERPWVFWAPGARIEPRWLVAMGLALGQLRRLLRQRAALGGELAALAAERNELTERFSNLIEDLNEVVIEFDLDGELIAVNSASSALVGFSPTELRSLRLGDFLSASDCQQVLHFTAEVGKGQGLPKLKRVVQLNTRGGAPMLAQLTVVPIIEGQRALGGRAIIAEATSTHRTLGVARKMARLFWSLASTLDRQTLIARFRAEIEAVSELPLHALYLCRDDRLVLTSADRRRYASLPAELLRTSVMGRSMTWGWEQASLGACSDPAAQQAGCPYALHLSRGFNSPMACLQESPCSEARYRQGKPGRCALAPVVDPAAALVSLQIGGQLLGVLVLGGPDPDSWRDEARLSRLSMIGQYLSVALNNVRLHHEALERSEKLERTLADLRRARCELVRHEQLAAASRVAAGLSHELRNPLNAMTLTLGNVKDEILGRGGECDAQLAEKIDPVLGEMKRFKQLLDELLRASRPRTRPPTRCDFNAILEEAIAFLRPQFDGRSIQIDCRLDSLVGAVLGHQDDLRRMLINLMLNADEAMEARGTLELSTSAREAELLCIVRDDGAGMSPEQQARAFDIFYTTKERGTGLGLSLVQRVVGGMGGSIHCVSTPGQGSEFRLRLPTMAPGEDHEDPHR